MIDKPAQKKCLEFEMRQGFVKSIDGTNFIPGIPYYMPGEVWSLSTGSGYERDFEDVRALLGLPDPNQKRGRER